ncbi:MAG: DUF4258 domain-containing protein [Gemmatimonadaceae bacterium]
MEENPDLGPLTPIQARDTVRRILEHGTTSFSSHAREEMANDDLQVGDCLNVLRGGAFEPPELINGTWRYRVSTNRICVVVVIPRDDRVRVVTVWRKK